MSNKFKDRKEEKRYEDQKSTPVIIKRNDESTRHPYDTLELTIKEGIIYDCLK